MTQHKTPLSLLVVATAICAGLYAVGSYATAYIPSPFGFGQFRPAVIVPALFGAIFGPFPAGLGAALGTLIADSTKHGYLYPGSFLAAVPGNFAGFFIFGYILKKRFTWTRFIWASVISLAVANAIVAFLYMFIFKALYAQALPFVADALTAVALGLTVYWFVTMLPFVLLVVPPLIRAIANAMPSLVSDDLRTNSLRSELPNTSFSLAMIIPGAIMVLIGLLTTFTALGDYTVGASNLAGKLLIELLYYIGGATLAVVGVFALLRRKKKQS
jgi:hypothetical protein